MAESKLKGFAEIIPNGLVGDLYNASPSFLSQALYQIKNDALPSAESLERLRRDARNVRDIQQYLRDETASLMYIEERKSQDSDFASRVRRFDEIVQEIRSEAEKDPMNVLRLKQLAAEQHQLIYGNDEQRIKKYRKQLGLPEEKSF